MPAVILYDDVAFHEGDVPADVQFGLRKQMYASGAFDPSLAHNCSGLNLPRTLLLGPFGPRAYDSLPLLCREDPDYNS
jgi:hypothetical protein